ncbi:hypothetical protein QJQ45_015474 [Haematococcus lacustris]|nr:hypothetical protein QJQ45_015474 [Haematococcus lacustris]
MAYTPCVALQSGQVVELTTATWAPDTKSLSEKRVYTDIPWCASGRQGSAPEMQVFYWVGQGTQRDGKTFHTAFALNSVTYQIGDSVFLYPEEESCPHYVGRIVSAFVDEHSGHADPHCIEVKWYERRVNLETQTKGIVESEREVFELEDTDINPIGCISSKIYIVRAQHYDEALMKMQGTQVRDWFFCRGYFMQGSNQFQPYSEAELAMQDGTLPMPSDLPQLFDSTLTAPLPLLEPPPAAPPKQVPRPTPAPAASAGGGGGGGGSGSRRQVTGRVCVECGATSTPQWREGPKGPKTLCNACGVRYGRIKHRLLKKTGGSSSGGRGRGGRGGSGAAAPSTQQYSSGSPRPHSHTRKQQQRDNEDDDDEEEEEEDEEEEAAPADLADVAPRRPSQRPMRQAAQAALARTAAYARTGDFGEGGAELQALLDASAGRLWAGQEEGGEGDSDPGAKRRRTDTSPLASLPADPLALMGLPPGMPQPPHSLPSSAAFASSLTPFGTTTGEGLGAALGAARGAGGAAGGGPTTPALQIEPLLVPLAQDGLHLLPSQGPPGGQQGGAAAVSPQDGASGAARQAGGARGEPAAAAVTTQGQGQGPSASQPAPPASLHLPPLPYTLPMQPANPGPDDLLNCGQLLALGATARAGLEQQPMQGSPRLLASSLVGSPKSGGHLLSPPPQSHAIQGLAGGLPAAGLPPAVLLGLHRPGSGLLATSPLSGSRFGGGLAAGGAATLALNALGDPAAVLARPSAASSHSPSPYQLLALHALRHTPAVGGLLEGMALFSTLDSLPPGSLPEEAVAKLGEVRVMMEAAGREAAAAEAAVTAVHQVYTARQEAAAHAKAEAAAAAARLREHLAQLLAQHQPTPAAASAATGAALLSAPAQTANPAAAPTPSCDPPAPPGPAAPPAVTSQEASAIQPVQQAAQSSEEHSLGVQAAGWGAAGRAAAGRAGTPPPPSQDSSQAGHLDGVDETYFYVRFSPNTSFGSAHTKPVRSEDIVNMHEIILSGDFGGVFDLLLCFTLSRSCRRHCPNVLPCALPRESMSDAVLQVFRWGSECRRQGNRQYYDSFRLEDREYRVGDAVCLHPENASTAPFVGRLVSCFSDSSVSQVDPHCIQARRVALAQHTNLCAGKLTSNVCQMQIQWYERLTNLEARYQGWTEKEHEVLEAGFLRTVTALRTTVQLAASPYIHSQLEETDVNPIGCIASKCTVFKAPNYEQFYTSWRENDMLANGLQAANEAARVLGPDDVWFFCRGVFRQSTGSFKPYQEFGGPAKTCSTHLATDAMSTHPLASLFSDDAGSGCDSEDATSATGASTPLAPASRPLPASIAAATSKRTRMSCLLPSSQLPALTVQHSSAPQTTAASSAVAAPPPSAAGAAGCCTEAGPEGRMLAGGASAGGASAGWVQADAAQSQAGQAPGSGTHTPHGAVGSVEAGTGAGLRSGGTGLARDSLGLASPSITSRAETGPGAGSGMVFLDDLSMSMTLTQGSYLASHAVGQGQGQGHSGMLSSSPPLPYLDWAASGSLARPLARHSLVGAGSSSLTPSLTTTSHPLGPPALQLATSARTGTPPPPQTQLGSPPATRRRQQQTAAVGGEVGVTCHTTSPAELGAQWGVPTRPGGPAAAASAGLPAALGVPGAAPLSSRVPAGGAAAAAALPHGGRSCLQCGVTTTPQWREGPMGPKTLCNACGVRYGRAQQRAGKQGGASAHDRRVAQGYDSQHRSAARAVQEQQQQQQLPSRRGSTRSSARGRQGASAGSGSGAGSPAVVPPLTTLTIPASGAGEGAEGGVLTLVDPGPPQLGTPPAVLMLPLHPHTPSTAAAAAAPPGAIPLALATAPGGDPMTLSFSLDCLMPCAAAAAGAGGSTAADVQLLVQSAAASPAPALVLASPLPTQSSLLSSCFTAMHATPSTPAAHLAASQAVGTSEAAGQVPEVCTSPHGHASQSRRPMRQAARMAASRTAEYARTGSFQAASCTHPSPSQPGTHPVHPVACSQEAQGRAQAAGHTTLEASLPALAPCTRTPGLPGPPSPPPSSPLPADLAAHSPNHSSLSDCDITTPLTQGHCASAHPLPSSSHQTMAASPSPGTGTELCLASMAPSPGPVWADSSSTGAGGSGGAGQAAPHPAGLLGSVASPLKRRREEPSAPHSLDTALAAPPPPPAAHALASATPPKPAAEGMLPAPTPKLEPWSFEAIACSGRKPAPALAAAAAAAPAVATAAPVAALLPVKHEGSQQVSGSVTAAGREQGVSGLTSIAGAAEAQTADLAGVAEALAQFNAVKEKLPPDVLEALQAAGEGVTRAAAEVTAAEAALSAVHQVLLSRTKAAEEARQEALTALGHMQSFVRDLVGQYPHLQAASCAQLEGVTSSTLSNMEDVDEVFGWGDLGLGRTFSAAASSPATTLTTAAAMMGAFQSLDSSSGRGADKPGRSASAAATAERGAAPPALSPDHTPNPASLPPRSARAAPAAAAAAAQAAAAAAAQATAAAAAAQSDTEDLFQHPSGSSPWASSPHAQCSTGTRGGLPANNCFSSSNLQASGWLAGHGAGGGAGLPPLLNMDDMGMDAAWDAACEGPGRQELGLPCGHADHSMRFETHHELGLSSNRMFSGGLLGDLDDLMVFSAMA